MFTVKLDTHIANAGLRRAMTAGEALSPKIPETKYSPTGIARDSYLAYTKYALVNDVFSPLGEFTQEMYDIYRTEHDITTNFPVRTFPNTFPWTAEQIGEMTFDGSVFITLFIAKNLRHNLRQFAIETITLAYCSLAKRGQVTDEFCTKVQNSVRDELGVPIVLSQVAITSLYRGYMQGVNETNAREVLSNLDALIPDIALRLKLTLQQAAGSGLTLYVIIGRALVKYNDFPWGRANTLTGGELVSWETARGIIGDNLYYGFKRDMGGARSTLYKSIGYVARELLVKINGERTLLRYAGLAGNIKNKQALDRLLEAYINSYMAEVIPETEAERQQVPDLNVVRDNPLFA